MKNFIKAMDKLPLLVKVILCLPILDIVWVVYRICKSIADNNTLGIILGIILIIVGIPFLWLVDLICVLVGGKVWWF